MEVGTTIPNSDPRLSNGRADFATIVNDNPDKLADALQANAIVDPLAGRDFILAGAEQNIIFADSVIGSSTFETAFNTAAPQNKFAILETFVRETLLAKDGLFNKSQLDNVVPGSKFSATALKDNNEFGQADEIFGGDGDDIIFAQGGDDIITGGSGNDILVGGAGRDIFKYNTGETGIDEIVDFENGFDRIDLKGMGVTGIRSTVNATSLQVSTIDNGTNTQLSVNGNPIAVLRGISGGIDNTDFIFA